MAVYTRHDVDRLYRSILDEAGSLWLTQPNYDTQPRERRPVDELPGDVTDYLTRVAALEALTLSQRTAFEMIVMGLYRVPRRDKTCVLLRMPPMTYAEYADYWGITESAAGHALTRARDRLAAALSDREDDAA